MTTAPHKPNKLWEPTAEAIADCMRSTFAHWAPEGTLVRAVEILDPAYPYAKNLGWYDEDTATLFLNTTAMAKLNPSMRTAGSTISHATSVIASDHGARATTSDRRNSGDQARNVMLMAGVAVHETAHAAWSNWADSPALNGVARPVENVMRLFEELRIERKALDHAAAYKPALTPEFCLGYLYAALLKQFADAEIPNQAALCHMWALARGRTISGVLDAADTGAIDEVVRTVVGDDTVDDMTEILYAAVVVDTETIEGVVQLRDLAEEWLKTVGDSSSGEGGGEPQSGATPGVCEGEGKSSGTPDPDSDSDDGSGSGGDAKNKDDDDDDDDSDADGSGSDDDDDANSDDSDDDDDDADGSGGDSSVDDSDGDDGDDSDGETNTVDDSISHGNGGEISENMKRIISEVLDETAFEWLQPEETGRKMADPNVVAPKVFGFKPLDHSKKRSFTSTPPSAKVRAAVAKLTQEFEKVALPQVIKTATRMALPPGRLNTREAVRRSAERSRGQMVTAKPWRGEKRRHTTAKPLVVGLATDTSGSMAWAEKMVAEAAYVFAHAGSRIGARTAAVTFGNHAEAVVKPGDLPREVVQRMANGGSEDFDNAAAALDGVLHLGHNDGSAKFICIISDAQLVRSGEIDVAMQWLDRWHKAGTYILWVGCASGYNGKRWLDKCPGVIYVDVDRNAVRHDPLVLVNAIGPKLQEAMRPKS